MADSEPSKPEVRKMCICCQGEFGGELTTCPNDGTFLSPIVADPLIGAVIHDTYEVLEAIGGGGMGQVYKARHRLLKRMVAIKVLHKTQITAGNSYKRFQLEAQAAGSLSMPHIVTINDFGTLPSGQPYMVMDYLPGRSLGAVLEEEGRLPVERGVKIFIQIASALGHAHSKGIVHRDVKPSNVVLLNLDGYNDFVKVVDFGIAKLVNPPDQDSGNLTRTGELFGSALYMSPEQCRSQKLDGRSDIYSLGALMYKVLAGTSMFPDGDMFQLVFMHMTEMPSPFASHNVEIPDELEAIVFKALAKEPEQRYQTMSELKTALEGFLYGRFEHSSSTATAEALAALPSSEAPDEPCATVPGAQADSTARSRSADPRSTLASGVHGVAGDRRAADRQSAADAAFASGSASGSNSNSDSNSNSNSNSGSNSGSASAMPQAVPGTASEVSSTTAYRTSPEVLRAAGDQTIQIVLPKRTIAAVAGAIGVVGIIAAVCIGLSRHDSPQSGANSKARSLPAQSTTVESVRQPHQEAETAAHPKVSVERRKPSVSQNAAAHKKPVRVAHRRKHECETPGSKSEATAPARLAHHDGGGSPAPLTQPSYSPPPASVPSVVPQPQAPPAPVAAGSSGNSTADSSTSKHKFAKFKSAFKKLIRKIDDF